MDENHALKGSKTKKSDEKGKFKRVDLPGINEVEGMEEAFNLEPVKLPPKEEQFSFGKTEQKKGNSQLISLL